MFLKKVPKFLSLAALMQDATVSNFCSLGYRHKTGISARDGVSQKNEVNIFIAIMLFVPLCYYSVMKNIKKFGSECTDLEESLFWVGVGKNRDPMGAQRGLWHGYKNDALSPRCKMYFREN